MSHVTIPFLGGETFKEILSGNSEERWAIKGDLHGDSSIEGIFKKREKCEREIVSLGFMEGRFVMRCAWR